MDQPDDMSTPSAPNGFTVPLRIELAELEVPLARLQAVQQGAVLSLADANGGLAVRILAGSRAIATGQIIAVGEGYAVLVEQIVGA
jgi:flagellar motor switch/type III secretory pathway protein FliN